MDHEALMGEPSLMSFDDMLSPQKEKIVHPLFVRVTHWINVSGARSPRPSFQAR
jgi:hypothetical protein